MSSTKKPVSPTSKKPVSPTKPKSPSETWQIRKYITQLRSEEPVKGENSGNLLVDLPIETLQQVLAFIPPHERMRVHLICKYFFIKLGRQLPSPTALTVRISNQNSGGEIFPRAILTWTEDKDIDAYEICVKASKTLVPPYPGLNGELILSYAKDPKLNGLTGIKNQFRLLSINNFGISQSTVEKILPQRELRYYCFNGEARVHMWDGSTKRCQDVVMGDVLRAADGGPTTVRRVKVTEIYSEYKMVDMGDFYITRGHPIYVNGDWYRPDELYPLCNVYIDVLYNFYSEPSHFIVVGEESAVKCSSLGGHCPRLAVSDPYSDCLYGRGYGTKEAERYSWLLALKERIPDRDVRPREPEYYTDLIPGREFVFELPTFD